MLRKFLFFIFISLVGNYVLADNVIDISRGKTDPIQIAINDFSSENSRLSKEILRIVQNDLQHSGLFRSIPKSAFIEEKIGIDHRPVFAAWQHINALLLLNGEVKKLDQNRVEVNFILWDNFLEKDIIKQQLIFPQSQWRMAAHKLANIIYEKMTGRAGYFNSKVTYVSETGSYLKRVKRIAMMDYDGHNHQFLTDGSDLVMTPRFSPNGKEILYLSYKSEVPSLYLLNIRTKKSVLLGDFPGMSFAPRFSPDGKHAVMSIAKDGVTHIYEMDLDSKDIRKLTQGSTINTSPSYSPDGKKIIFNSDRNGARQLFTMDRNGTNIERISFGGGAYAEPVWSNSDFITFTKMSRSIGFAIGIMKPETYQESNNERLIASGYLVETPAWSSNGQMIIFARGNRPTNKSSHKGLSRLYMIDFTGHNERLVPTPHDAYSPDWL